MRANYGGNLLPEQMLRGKLQKVGLRFRKHIRPVPEIRCEADIVFPKKKVCIFVDGCFWHGCPRHFTCPKTHADWWKEKVESNRARDRKRSRELTARGWKVLRVWEHSVLENLGSVANRIRLLTSEAAAP
jgi:DNA mismatch endonuclease, patch repair protein